MKAKKKRIGQSHPEGGHAGDCTFYSSTINCRPYDGICTCGYGWEVRTNTGSESELISVERSEFEVYEAQEDVVEKLVEAVTKTEEFQSAIAAMKGLQFEPNAVPNPSPKPDEIEKPQ